MSGQLPLAGTWGHDLGKREVKGVTSPIANIVKA